MPIIHKRNCDYCNKYYENVGKKYCSSKCAHKAMIGEKASGWINGKKKFNCLFCEKEFYRYETKRNNAKFCSKECCDKAKIGIYKPNSGNFKKGGIPWNKGKELVNQQNERNFNWKGDNVGYHGIHKWVSRHKGKPQFCIDCGKTADKYRIDWSNIDHKYRRNLDDYQSRCASCHKLYDLKNNFSPHYLCIANCKLHN